MTIACRFKTTYTIDMSFLESFFLSTFLIMYNILFPFFRRPVWATYCVILGLIIWGTYRLFLKLKTQSLSARSWSKKGALLALWGVFFYLVFMIIWYILIHFRTYKLMS
jgi:hypothetical protein